MGTGWGVRAGWDLFWFVNWLWHLLVVEIENRIANEWSSLLFWRRKQLSRQSVDMNLVNRIGTILLSFTHMKCMTRA